MKKYILLFSLFLIQPALAYCPENSAEAFCTARRVITDDGYVGFLYSVYFDYTPEAGQLSVMEQFNRWLQIDNAAVAGFEAAASQFFDEPFVYDNKGSDVFGYYWHLPTDQVLAVP